MRRVVAQAEVEAKNATLALASTEIRHQQQIQEIWESHERITGSGRSTGAGTSTSTHPGTSTCTSDSNSNRNKHIAEESLSHYLNLDSPFDPSPGSKNKGQTPGKDIYNVQTSCGTPHHTQINAMDKWSISPMHPWRYAGDRSGKRASARTGVVKVSSLLMHNLRRFCTRWLIKELCTHHQYSHACQLKLSFRWVDSCMSVIDVSQRKNNASLVLHTHVCGPVHLRMTSRSKTLAQRTRGASLEQPAPDVSPTRPVVCAGPDPHPGSHAADSPRVRVHCGT